jgi:hypothetical protein
LVVSEVNTRNDVVFLANPGQSTFNFGCYRQPCWYNGPISATTSTKTTSVITSSTVSWIKERYLTMSHTLTEQGSYLWAAP